MSATRILGIALAATVSAFASGAAQAQGSAYNKIQLQLQTTADGRSFAHDLPAPRRASPILMVPLATGTHIPRAVGQNKTETVGAARSQTVGAAQFAAGPKPLKAK